MNKDFMYLFEKLRYELSCDYGNDTKLTKIIDEIINYINKIMGQDFKINHVTKEEITEIQEDALLFAEGSVINYSTELIRECKKLIKNTRTENYNPDYNDITYAMLLINIITHELCHCQQYIDQINGVLNEQTYLNTLSYAYCLIPIIFKNLKYNDEYNIEYLDRSYEGEAYGFGVKMMNRLLNKNILENPLYSKSYNAQINGWNFFKKTILFHEVVYYLDRIPFMKKNNRPYSIIKYVTDRISQLKLEEVKELMKYCPLIMVGLEEENGKCRIKKSHELIEQYFGGYIKFGQNKKYINDVEKPTLIDIYVYLLLEQLTPEIYNDLIKQYGKSKMDTFMLSLKDNINKKINIYEESYQESLKRIQKIRTTDKTILKHIDEEYAKEKYKAAKTYMRVFTRKIDKFTMSKQNNKILKKQINRI